MPIAQSTESVVQRPPSKRRPVDQPLVPLLRIWPHLRLLCRHRWPDQAELHRLQRNQAALSDIYRIEPGMLWIAWLCALGAEDVGDGQLQRASKPIQSLRRAFPGVGKLAWKRLLQRRPEEFPPDHEAVLSHLLREQLIGQDIPSYGQAYDWMCSFDVATQPGADVELAGRSLAPPLARTLATEGLCRIATDDWLQFSSSDLPRLLAWLDDCDAADTGGKKTASFARLLHLANDWHAERLVYQSAKGEWTCLTDTLEFKDYYARPLTNRLALWQEGVHMHHCIGSYSERCAAGRMRAFHVRPAANGMEWTLALVWAGIGEWQVHDFRGLANLIPAVPVRAWADEFAGWYGTIEPATSAAQYLDDDDDNDEAEDDGNQCPICDAEEACDAHLVAAIDSGDGILGGEVYDVWEPIHSQLKDRIFDALVASRRRTGFGSEVDSVLKRLRDSRAEWDLPDADAGPADAHAVADSERLREAFEEELSNLGADQILRNHMEEVLGELPGVHARSFEVSSAPGLSWSGYNYFAENPKNAVVSFVAAFAP